MCLLCHVADVTSNARCGSMRVGAVSASPILYFLDSGRIAVGLQSEQGTHPVDTHPHAHCCLPYLTQDNTPGLIFKSSRAPQAVRRVPVSPEEGGVERVSLRDLSENLSVGF